MPAKSQGGWVSAVRLQIKQRIRHEGKYGVCAACFVTGQWVGLSVLKKLDGNMVRSITTSDCKFEEYNLIGFVLLK